VKDNANVEIEGELAEFIATFYDDPLGFVMAVYPWGEPVLADGAFNPLHNKTGPEEWQRDELNQIGAHIKENRDRLELGLDMLVYRSATASGHGVGKSALVAWVIHFLMSTRVDTRMAITASTQFQLEDKTWPELAKWQDLAINGHWFKWTATTYSFAAYPEERRKNYRATAATVSETNTEAFAGLHNEGKTVAVIFDEASGVLPKIWEVVEGALTDGEPFFWAFGNPTQPDGEFADCFDKHSDMYKTRHVDSRSVSFTNKNALNDIIRKYGEDSDQAKVRVRGQFPTVSFDAFIPQDAVMAAQAREEAFDADAGLIMGVDGARSEQGDKFRITWRQGRDARSRPSLEFPGMRTLEAARVVSREADRTKPDAIVIEGTGPTTGLIDVMRDRGYPVHEVYPGAPSPRAQEFQNNRAEWWWDMREWIWEEGVLPDTQALREQLTNVRYSYQRQTDKLVMESKEDLKVRLSELNFDWKSPDEADSLMLTFAVRVARRDRNSHHAARTALANMSDDPLA
jgi:hypothetical protein